MTTGNKPTAALQYPSIGSLAAKLLTAEVGVPPYVTFGDLRGGTAGLAGLPRHGVQPVRRRGQRRRRQGERRGGGFSVRGITLERHSRSTTWRSATSCCASSTAASRRSTRSNDLVDGLDTFHQQALEILRRDKTKKAFDLNAEKPATRETVRHHAVRPGALAARRLVEAGRPLRDGQPRRLGHARPDLQRPQDAAAAAARPDAVGPDRATWTTAACWTARS